MVEGAEEGAEEGADGAEDGAGPGPDTDAHGPDLALRSARGARCPSAVRACPAR